MTEVIVQIQYKVPTSQFLYPSYGTKTKDILLSVRQEKQRYASLSSSTTATRVLYSSGNHVIKCILRVFKDKYQVLKRNLTYLSSLESSY
ncbi:hypothetical protein [Albatrosspox virus]|nr:hypothetical protein [Penguinpox virus 2]QRM16040.1 hypothetical protein [Albatrosspox virus]